MAPKVSDGLSPMQARHRTLLEHVQSDALGVVGAANRVAQSIGQVLEQGGQVSLQAQISYLTGAMARLQKDWGAIELLQSTGTTQRRRPTV